MSAFLSNLTKTLSPMWENLTTPPLTPVTNSQPTSLVLPELTYVYVTVTVFYVIVFMFGIVGNVLVIYVVCTQRDMLTPTNMFLVNLSVADLLVLLVCMPSSLVEFHARDVWLLGDVMCEYCLIFFSSLLLCSRNK